MSEEQQNNEEASVELVPIGEALPALNTDDYADVREWHEARMRLADHFDERDGDYLRLIRDRLTTDEKLGSGAWTGYLNYCRLPRSTAYKRIAKAEGHAYINQPHPPSGQARLAEPEEEASSPPIPVTVVGDWPPNPADPRFPAYLDALKREQQEKEAREEQRALKWVEEQKRRSEEERRGRQEPIENCLFWLEELFENYGAPGISPSHLDEAIAAWVQVTRQDDDEARKQDKDVPTVAASLKRAHEALRFTTELLDRLERAWRQRNRQERVTVVDAEGEGSTP